MKRILDLLGISSRPPVEQLDVEEAHSIDEVVARMRMLAAGFPRNDGVGYFNRMYLQVTEDVLNAGRGRAFEDREFLERLDVVFANLYFKSVTDHGRDPASCFRSWVPLFDLRSNRRIAPIQFALAGMNAHINHDLVRALVTTCRELDRELERDSPHYRDFVYVNELLVAAQAKVEPWLKRGLLGVLDRLLGAADEVAESWSMQRARENAWVQAETLWRIGETGALGERFLLALDRTVGLAGRGLLLARIF